MASTAGSLPPHRDKQLHYGVVGHLDRTFEAMELSADPGLTLLVYTAEADSPTWDALSLLLSWAATLTDSRGGRIDSSAWLHGDGVPMSKLRVHNFSLSLDGYAAGPDQNLDNPLGVGGGALHDWAFATRTFQHMFGTQGGDDGLDDTFAARGEVGIGATIMGRNMFGPVRGPWSNDDWTGWWGEEPPFHHEVFVLTHHARASVSMEGGTTFHFVSDGIEAATERAFEAAGDQDVKIGGGSATIQQFLRAGLVDEMHLAIVPVLLGSGERLFANLGPEPLGYECVEFVGSPSVVHARFARLADQPGR